MEMVTNGMINNRRHSEMQRALISSTVTDTNGTSESMLAVDCQECYN